MKASGCPLALPTSSARVSELLGRQFRFTPPEGTGGLLERRHPHHGRLPESGADGLLDGQATLRQVKVAGGGGIDEPPARRPELAEGITSLICDLHGLAHVCELAPERGGDPQREAAIIDHRDKGGRVVKATGHRFGVVGESKALLEGSVGEFGTQPGQQARPFGAVGIADRSQCRTEHPNAIGVDVPAHDRHPAVVGNGGGDQAGGVAGRLGDMGCL